MQRISKILIAYMPPDDSAFLPSVLAGHGRELFLASSFLQSVEEVKSHDFGLIIIDTRTSLAEALSLAKYLHGESRTRRVPILLVNVANSELVSSLASYSTGIIDILGMSFDVNRLSRTAKLFIELDQQRQELQASCLRMQLALDGYGIIERNLGNGGFFLSDSWFEETLGYQGVSRLDPGDWINCVFPDDKEELIRGFLTFLAGQELRYATDCRISHQSGAIVWIRARINCERNDDASPRRIVAQLVDITKEKNLEIELQRRSHAEVHTAKMHTLGELAAGIAHEINNPIFSIRSMAFRLQKLARDPGLTRAPAIGEAAAAIDDNAEKIAEIVRTLKIYGRQEENDPHQKVRLTDVVGNALSICRARFESAETDVAFTVSTIPADVMVSCLPGQIAQVVINLLANAHYAAALTHSPTKWVRLDAHVVDGKVAVCVVDSGSGVQCENAESIFEPFFTTKPAGSGTGLGLSISRRIAEAHGGSLYLDQGTPETTFVLVLPMAEA